MEEKIIENGTNVEAKEVKKTFGEIIGEKVDGAKKCIIRNKKKLITAAVAVIGAGATGLVAYGAGKKAGAAEATADDDSAEETNELPGNSWDADYDDNNVVDEEAIDRMVDAMNVADEATSDTVEEVTSEEVTES